MDNYKRIKIACYGINITMAAVANLSPLLFVTFHNEYSISYTALGLLVLINFSTQLFIDLLFSFFSHRLSAHLALKITPVLSGLGLLVYAMSPFIFPTAPYIGILIGTLIASAASGLAEVLISALIAAIPSEKPDSEMSKLHSVYAWGVVAIIVISTLFLTFVGGGYWYILPLIYTLIPIVCAVLFFTSDFPPMCSGGKNEKSSFSILKRGSVWLCIIGIFIGGATELTIAQWCSSFSEEALGIPKVLGDILGAAAFATMMGLGRSLYSKWGKRIEPILLISIIGACVCYLTAALSPVPAIALIACALCGLCTAMLWPGALIAVNERAPDGGVFIYALMAAGGDLGASVGPQMVGFITDTVAKSEVALSLAQNFGITPETVGMRAGMLISAIFPIVGIIIFACLYKGRRKDALIIK